MRFQYLLWPQLECLILGNYLTIGSFTLRIDWPACGVVAPSSNSYATATTTNSNISVETIHEGKATTLRNQQLRTDRTIHNNKPDIIIRDN